MEFIKSSQTGLVLKKKQNESYEGEEGEEENELKKRNMPPSKSMYSHVLANSVKEHVTCY